MLWKYSVKNILKWKNQFQSNIGTPHFQIKNKLNYFHFKERFEVSQLRKLYVSLLINLLTIHCINCNPNMNIMQIFNRKARSNTINFLYTKTKITMLLNILYSLLFNNLRLCLIFIARSLKIPFVLIIIKLFLHFSSVPDIMFFLKKLCQRD